MESIGTFDRETPRLVAVDEVAGGGGNQHLAQLLSEGGGGETDDFQCYGQSGDEVLAGRTWFVTDSRQIRTPKLERHMGGVTVL